MKLFNVEQRSAEWWRLRRGIPTASSFDKIMSPVKCVPSTSQDGFIDSLIAESIDQVYSCEPEDSYVSKSMQNGIDTEPEARSWYAMRTDQELTEVGFCLSDCGRYGCSPDALVGENGMIEVKCPDLKTHIRYVRNGTLPSEYKCQVHGSLLVTRREWCDFISYSPSDEIDSLIIRVYPDDFTATLQGELEKFLRKYQSALDLIRKPIIRPVDEPPKSQLDKCIGFLQRRMEDGNMRAISSSETGFRFVLPSEEILTIGDHAKGLNCVNTFDHDALDQIKAHIAMAESRMTK